MRRGIKIRTVLDCEWANRPPWLLELQRIEAEQLVVRATKVGPEGTRARRQLLEIYGEFDAPKVARYGTI